jgi:ribosome-binding protein aMBF1 (putative translation factor)
MVWAEQEKRGWSDAKLAAEMREDSAVISRLVYGDRRANRQQAAWFLSRFEIPLEAWDEPCPVRRRKHKHVRHAEAS